MRFPVPPSARRCCLLGAQDKGGLVVSLSESKRSEPARLRTFERRCSLCKKIGLDFSPSAHRCRPCARLVNQTRYSLQQAEIKALRVDAAAQALTHVARTLNVVIVDSPEDVLLQAMAAFMAEKGFSELRLAVVRLENDLAQANRRELARAGWVV